MPHYCHESSTTPGKPGQSIDHRQDGEHTMRKGLMEVFEIMKLTKMFKFAANEGDALAMFD